MGFQSLREMTKEETEDAVLQGHRVWDGGWRFNGAQGTNRINLYTVAKSFAGLAEYVKKNSAQ